MISEQLTDPVDPAPLLFPPAADRAAWRKAAGAKRTENLRKKVLKDAEAALDAPIPELRASEFMRFVRNGNRRGYETPYFARRYNLEVLTLAEALEYRGRFLDPMIDYLWAILSEPVWTLPAHCTPRKFTKAGAQGGEEIDPLPFDPCENIDLFSAETAMVVTQTLRLFEPELAECSPNLVARLRQILFERVVTPFAGGGVPFWWSEGINNWTPWVVSNLLDPIRYLLADRDPSLCLDLLRRLTACTDRFLARYPADGACDEGPGYWNVSPARLFWVLEELLLMSHGKVNGFRDPQVRIMGEYIVDSHLGGNYFSAFCDSPVTLPLLPSGVVYRYGERTGSEKLMHFANREPQAKLQLAHTSLLCSLAQLFWLPAEPEKTPPEPAAAWYPSTQQAFLKGAGFSLAVKAGSNGEGHNHNDVGQFILFRNNRPFLVDLGHTEYTRFTFSKQRYENWQLTSLAHNVPAIDGAGQPPGGEFRARSVTFRDEESCAIFEADLAGAYAPETGLEELRRTLIFDSAAGKVTLTDRWRAAKPVEVTTPFFTPAVIEGNGPTVFLLTSGGVKLSVTFAGDGAIRPETRELEDLLAKRNWGDSIHLLTVSANGRQGEYTLVFSQEA